MRAFTAIAFAFVAVAAVPIAAAEYVPPKCTCPSDVSVCQVAELVIYGESSKACNGVQTAGILNATLVTSSSTDAEEINLASIKVITGYLASLSQGLAVLGQSGRGHTGARRTLRALQRDAPASHVVGGRCKAIDSGPVRKGGARTAGAPESPTRRAEES